MDTGLDQNEAELGVLVLAVALEVLADGDGLDIDTMVVSIHGAGLDEGQKEECVAREMV